VTFYVTTLLSEGLYVMYEICSISMPSSLQDMRSFVANAEDLLPIRSIFKQCQIKEQERVSQMKKEGITYELLKHLLKTSKSRKRACPFTFHK
jgi:hypothetical protein